MGPDRCTRLAKISPALGRSAQDCFEQAGESVVNIVMAKGIQQRGTLAAGRDKTRFSQDAKMMRGTILVC